MAWNPASSSTSPSRSALSVTAGGSPQRSQSTNDIVAQVAREKVVETLQQEVGAARREGKFASSELAEVREACRAENLKSEQERQRLTSRLKGQKTRLEEAIHHEQQARQMLALEIEERKRLEIKLMGADHRHEEQRSRELGGARAQLVKLQQRCREAEEAQAALQQSAARELGDIEAVDSKAAKKQQSLELQEHELSKLSIAREISQAALETSKCEAVALSVRLASVEELSQRTVQDHLRCRDEFADAEARVSQVNERAEEEAQRWAELRFELLHALHQELPSERSRVSELEARERAEADRIRGVCEAEVSDLPPNLIEKVQSAIRRHEALWFQWSHSRSPSPSGKKDSGSTAARSSSAAVMAMPNAGNTLTSATTRYEAVLGALAQCAGASARENMELRARLAGTWNSEEELPPDVQKQLTMMKREITKVCEENHELKLQRHVQEDAVVRLKREMQNSEAVKDVQLMNKARRKAPGQDVLFQTEHRRKVRLFEAEVQVAERQAEAAKLALQDQESSHCEAISGLQQEVFDLRQKCRESATVERASQRSELQVIRLQAELSDCKASSEEEACQKPSSPAKLERPSSEMTVSKAQHAAVQQRLAVVHRRLADVTGGRAQERELIRICERLTQDIGAERRERRALAEKYRSRESSTLELQSRCTELECMVQQRDGEVSEWKRQVAMDRQLLEVESLRESLTTSRPEQGRAPTEASKCSGSRSLRKRRSEDVPSQLSKEEADETPSPARAASAPPASVEEQRLRGASKMLLSRWVQKAVTSQDDSPPEERGVSRSPSAASPRGPYPHQMLLSRWVRKAVEGQDDNSLEERGAARSASTASPVASPSHLVAAGQVAAPRDETEGSQSPEQAQTSTPRSPSGEWLTRLGIDFSSPLDTNPAAANAGPAVGTNSPTATTSPDATNSPSATTSPVPETSGDAPEAGDGSALSPQSSETATPAEPSNSSSEWRGLDINDTGMMQWLNEVDQALPSLTNAGTMLGTPGSGRCSLRLPSVAEEPSGNSPLDGGPGLEEEADLEEVFQQAEVLCDSQRYEEALPIFHEILGALKDKGWSHRSSNMRSLEAEVRAHLGVALQSLGRVEEAIEAYSSAVQRDPSLHVCQANLAQLHAYLEDPLRARMHLNAALRLDPTNLMYSQLDEQFRASEDAGTLGM